MTTMRKVSTETTTLPGLAITMTVYKDPDGEYEDRVLLHLAIGDDAALAGTGPIARECPLPELANEPVDGRHGYDADLYCANGEDRCTCKLKHSLPGMITPADGRIRVWPEEGLRQSIAVFATAYRKRLEWLAARRASLA